MRLVRECPYAACEFYKILRQKRLGNAILCGAVPVAHTLALPCSVSHALLSLCRTSPPLLCTAGSRKPVNPLRLHPGGSHALQTRKRCVHSGSGKEASVPFVIHPVSRQCSDCLSLLRAIDIHPVFRRMHLCPTHHRARLPVQPVCC